MKEPKVHILMSTYNGHKFLREQLDSIFKQTYNNFTLYVRDDGSNDGTNELVEEYIERKLDYFTINWYIEKLSDCRPDERESCIDVIDQIVKLYGKTIQDYERYL